MSVCRMDVAPLVGEVNTFQQPKHGAPGSSASAVRRQEGLFNRPLPLPVDDA